MAARLVDNLWYSSSCEHNLKALVRIYAMIDIATYCCPYLFMICYLRCSWPMAILDMIDGCKLNSGPDFISTVIVVRMIASPRPACCENEVWITNQRVSPETLLGHMLTLLCTHKDSGDAQHSMTSAALCRDQNGRHAPQNSSKPHYPICNSR